MTSYNLASCTVWSRTFKFGGSHCRKKICIYIFFNWNQELFVGDGVSMHVWVHVRIFCFNSWKLGLASHGPSLRTTPRAGRISIRLNQGSWGRFCRFSQKGKPWLSLSLEVTCVFPLWGLMPLQRRVGPFNATLMRRVLQSTHCTAMTMTMAGSGVEFHFMCQVHLSW